MKKSSVTLTEGPIWKAIVLFALPVFLGQVFQQLYNTFDAWCVGNYISDDALAAVSSSGSLIFLMVSFFNGLAMGAGVVIARAYGAKEYDTMSKTIHTAIAFGLVTGTLLTIVGVTLTPYILQWMGTPKDVLPLSVSYFRYYFCGAIFTVMYNIFVGIHHAVGDSRHPLYYLMISTAVNIGLDMLFVAVMGKGVGSAAVATTIAQGISALLCFIHLLRVDAPYRVRFRRIGFHWKSLWQIIRYGLPSAVQNSVIALANVFVQSNINSFGKYAMAGCGSYSRLEGFAFLPVTCFTQALSTFVGQNLGAKQHDRVKKGVGFGIACSCIIAELIGILSYVFAEELIGIFADSRISIGYGAQHMKTICLFYCLLAFSHCIAGVMRGAGKPTVPMFTMLGCWCLFRVTYITVAIRYMPKLLRFAAQYFPALSRMAEMYRPKLTIVSWAYPITWCLSSIIFLICFLCTDWIHNFDRQEEKKKRVENAQ